MWDERGALVRDGAWTMSYAPAYEVQKPIVYPEARLLLTHEYERLALVWRLAEMLTAGSSEEKPLEVRTQHGSIPGWDDIVEKQRMASGSTMEVRWQIKRQFDKLEVHKFDALLHAMCHHEFEARILAPASFDVSSVGPIRILRDLLDRYRRAAPDHAKKLGGLTNDQSKWLDHISKTVGEEQLDHVLRRLQIRCVGDDRNLAHQAQAALRSLFSDPGPACSALLAYVGEKRDPDTVFTASDLLTGPLRSLTITTDKKWHGSSADIHGVAQVLSRRYGGDEQHLPLTLTCNGNILSSAKALGSICSQPYTFITGESGVGKTVLIHELAAKAISLEKFALIVQSFRGQSISAWMDGAARVLGAPDFDRLAEAIKAANQTLIVFLDGFDNIENEDQTLRDAWTIAERQSAVLVIASRRSTRSDVPTIEIPLPSDAEKRALWQHYAGNRAADDQLIGALRARIDVKLAAEAQCVLPDPTRYKLIESVIEGRGVSPVDRKKMQRCADFMAQKYRPSVRVTEIQRRDLCPGNMAGMLVVEDGWIRFTHDVFQVFFLAEHISRQYHEPSDLVAALQNSRHQGVREQLLSADLGADTLSALVETIESTELAGMGLRGDFGARVADLCKKRLSGLFDAAHDEISRIALHLSMDGTLFDFSITSPLTRALAPLQRGSRDSCANLTKSY